MKTLIISLGCIAILIFAKETKSDQQFCHLSHNIYSNCNFYKVVKIDSVGRVYLVYVERNDSIFKIMSVREEVMKCRPIERENLYQFQIYSWFAPDQQIVKSRVSGVKYEGVLVKLERDSIVGDLFLTHNLKGLCYVKNQN